MKALRVKVLIFVVLVALSIWALIPTYQLYFGGTQLSPEASSRLHRKALHLGLDLVGGMHVVLEVDKSQLTASQLQDATDRALTVIRNRIDRYGVTEPIIQKTSGDRILVQLPGVDRDRAMDLIGKTALLEFKLLEDDKKAYEILLALDSHFKKGALDTAATGQGQGAFTQYVVSIGNDLAVEDRDQAAVAAMVDSAASVIPPEDQVLFGPTEDYRGRIIRRLYVAKKQAVMTGGAIADARHELYQGAKTQQANTWVVTFTLNKKDARTFARITGENVNKRLAIVLDNVVSSAPIIEERIPGGRGEITTGETDPEKAKVLAVVLQSGSLPAPIIPLEERSVGPSLGLDSIRKGIRAMLIGAAIVVLFMAIYYSVAGVISIGALFFNMFFLLAVLASLRATLTLPGLAGMALTIGMAVDANVLIFERVREELRLGKTVRSAIDTGYARAFVTIFDSNMTTLITTVFIYIFGSGPIRGFALTLGIGLIINIITAVYLTRMVYDFMLARGEVRKLRI